MKWADLLKRVWEIDALACPKCKGRMTAMAVIEDPGEIARYLVGAFHFHSFLAGVGVAVGTFAGAAFLDEVLLWCIVRLGYSGKGRALRAASACPTCGSQRKRPIRKLRVGPLRAPCVACRQSRDLYVKSVAESWETD